MVLLIFLQLTPKMIPGDEKLTLEGNYYGLYMFESNHQCISNATYYFEDETTETETHTSMSARNRCDPYQYWFRFNEICEHKPEVERVAWTFDHSINGNSFLRIVDLEDACSVDYSPFGRNEWIKTHEDNPPAMGKPAKNLYY